MIEYHTCFEANMVLLDIYLVSKIYVYKSNNYCKTPRDLKLCYNLHRKYISFTYIG